MLNTGEKDPAEQQDVDNVWKTQRELPGRQCQPGDNLGHLLLGDSWLFCCCSRRPLGRCVVGGQDL